MAFEFSDGLYFAMAAPFVAALIAPHLWRLMGHNAAWLLALVPASIFVYLCGFIELVAHEGVGVKPTPITWLPQYNIQYSLFVDGLSLLFALLISGIGIFIILYAGGFLRKHPEQGRFFCFLFLFMGSMLGVVLADNLLTLFTYWELTSITSFLLIGFNHLKRASRRAAMQALVITGGGGLALLPGLILMGYAGGTMEMSELIVIGDVLREHSLYVPMLILILLGAFTKSAQYPFHSWLRNAMEAPTPVSAYLHSATMVKAGVYFLMRVHPVMGSTELWMYTLQIVGGFTMLMGTRMALRQLDLKKALAYTTIASLGLLVMLVGTSSEAAIAGAVLYLFAHALAKGGLFMMVGTITDKCGTSEIAELRGLRHKMPITFVAANLGAMSVGGIYPFLGFVAKEEIYRGLQGGSWNEILLTIIAVAGNSMMFAAVFVVSLKPFLGEETEKMKGALKDFQRGPWLLLIGPIALSSLGLLFMFIGPFLSDNLLTPMLYSVLGYHSSAKLTFAVHFNEALILSLVTIAGGIFIYYEADYIRSIRQGIIRTIGKGPDDFFDTFVTGLIRFSARVTRLLQTGNLEVYLAATFVVAAGTMLTPMILFDELPDWPSMPSLHFYEWAVVLLAVVGLFAVIIAKTRLTAIISLGIQGFSVALIFLMFGAPDLAFTQFMVETLSVVIIALVMNRLSLEERDKRPLAQTVGDSAVAIVVGGCLGLLLMSVTQGSFDTSLPNFFTDYSRVIAHGRNIVNVIIVDFRGLDTLGEIAVVMITALCVFTLTLGTAKQFRGGQGAKDAALPSTQQSQDQKGADQ
ncbi:putative monovalent cation/H+ antiporter subunit A [Cohaesibacter intestini]|uniref:putative monovalent cation/H+ antiporter subunit A n=1 Tax=Cohaesibacter intestini TaxID=2211145 RepID=UPI000DE84E4A